MSKAPRITLIHATDIAIEPVRKAFAAGWPEAEVTNLLDDSLTADASRLGAEADILTERLADLAHHACKLGADGILYTCSAFGPAIEAAARKVDVPVLKPNEAMYEAALASGSRIAMIVTFAPSRASMEAEFAEAAARAGSPARLETVLVEPAMAALRAGDRARHDALVAEAAAGLEGFDALMLAHFSTAPAAAAAQERTRARVLTSPGAAVAKMRALIESRPQRSLS